MPDTAPVVLATVENGIGTVTLNRPDSLNAMSVQLMDDLRDALHSMAEDDAVRCVVLRGAGRAFCAGGDTGTIATRQSDAAAASSPGALVERLHRAMVRHTESVLLLKTMSKPTVAVVQGWAVGGGMSLALAADFRVLGASARMRPAFIPLSLSGDFGISALLVASLGSARAREILLLDRTIDASAAADLGLATLVVPDAQLDARADDFIATLATGPTIALGRAKDNLAAAETLGLADYLVVESINQRVSATTADALESGAAIAEKRQPRFTGR